MAIEKQFDEEMGYAASRELPVAVAQYMKATGKSEEQVAKEIINKDPEWLDWTTHTKHPGNSTPEDNGWTDLKKLGLGISRSVSDSWMNHRNNTDPMWRVGLVNAMFGDPSMLGQYYQMQNQNAENEKNRQVQKEYNDMFKEIDGKTELARLGKEYVQAKDEPTRLYLKQEMRRQAAKAGVPENEIEDFINTYTGAKDSQLETERIQRVNFNTLANKIRKNGIPSREVPEGSDLSPWDEFAVSIEETNLSDEQRDSLYRLLEGKTADEEDAEYQKDKTRKDNEAEEARRKAEADEKKKHAEEVARQKAGVRAKINAKKKEIEEARNKTLLTKAAKLTEELKSLEAELAAIK